MKSIKGPGIFLAQFAGDEAPFNSFDAICRWAASLGYKGVQIPSWDGRLFDLKRASESKDYCDEIAGVAASHGLVVTELSTHLQASSSPFTRPMTRPSTGSPPRKCAAIRPRGRNGRWIRSSAL